MDRTRDERSLTMAASTNGFSRRRHRASSLRDSPADEDGPVELQETVRLRDRGGSLKKDRDREREREKERERERERDRFNSRGGRRRGERQIHGSRENVVDDSSEESMNEDEEEYDEDEGGAPAAKVLPPHSSSAPSYHASLVSNHHSKSSNSFPSRKSFLPPAKAFRATPSATTLSSTPSPWKAADEMIGVSVPRRARSASTKRSHESWSSSAVGGVFGGGEQIHRQSSSPARGSSASLLTSCSPAPASPSSCGGPTRKKMPFGQKQRFPKSSSKSSSPSVQDEIEIEVAEVLYGMLRQTQAPSKQDVAGNDLANLDSREQSNPSNTKPTNDTKPRVSSPISNSQCSLPHSSLILTSNSTASNTSMSTMVPKRKRPRPVIYDDEKPSRSIPFSSNTKADLDQTVKMESAPPVEKLPGSVTDNDLASSTLKGSQAVQSLAEVVKPDQKPVTVSKPVGEGSQDRVASVFNDEPCASEKEAPPGNDLVEGVHCSEAPARESQRDEKFQIDLMAPPPTRTSPERESVVDCVAAVASKPKAAQTEMEGKSSLDEKVVKSNKDIDDASQEPNGKKIKLIVEAELQKAERSMDQHVEMEKSDTANANGSRVSQHVLKHQQRQPSPPIHEKSSQSTSMPLHVPMAGWPGSLPSMGYMAPMQGVVPMDGTTLTSSAIQAPHLLFNHPRPKRCATHYYIARNIQNHQQVTKMNPFWQAAAASAPFYGAKSCNMNVVGSTELQNGLSGRASNSVQDKNSQHGANVMDHSQRKQQILLQQGVPPGAPSNMLHGPAFIFPLNQQHAAAAAAAASVRPGIKSSPGMGNSMPTVTSNSASGSGSSSAAHSTAATTMSFNYANMPGNETQYVAILQNNAYPFPVPAHVGGPAYRGASGQAIPFFNGSLYPSQMFHPSHLQLQQSAATQVPQSQKQQGHQNPGSVSSGSSGPQKHLQSNHQLMPRSDGATLQGFPAQKNQTPRHLQFQQPSQNTPNRSETGGEDSPSTADSRVSRTYGQNFAMQMQPPNIGLMPTMSIGGMLHTSFSNQGERKLQNSQHPQQQQVQAFAVSYPSMNGATSAPGFDISAITQNHAVLSNFPEAARQGYQIMTANVAAQQKKSVHTSEEGKSGANDKASGEEERKGFGTGKSASVTPGQSIAFSRPDLSDATISGLPGSSVVDSSARSLNLSASNRGPGPVSSSTHQQLQRNPQQQQQILQLHKQQQYAAAAAAAARGKTPPAGNGTAYTSSTPGAVKFPNTMPAFPQSFVQSTQWKNTAGTNTAQVQSPSSSVSSHKSHHQKHQGRQQQSHLQTQISFAANPKTSGNHQVQQPTNSTNQSPSPPVVGSPSTSSISKGHVGSPRANASNASGGKGNQVSSGLSSQPVKNSPLPNQKHVPSILGNPHVSTTLNAGSKSQVAPQQQQLPKHALHPTQLFFAGAYIQPQTSSIAPHSGFYLQRHRNEAGLTTSSTGMLSMCAPASNTNTSLSDPAKAISAASNMKGGSLPAQGLIHGAVPFGTQVTAGKNQSVPVLPYVHAVPAALQVKPAEQKQPAGE